MGYYYLGCFSICPSLQLPLPPSPIDKYHRSYTSHMIFFLTKVLVNEDQHCIVPVEGDWHVLCFYASLTSLTSLHALIPCHFSSSRQSQERALFSNNSIYKEIQGGENKTDTALYAQSSILSLLTFIK